MHFRQQQVQLYRPFYRLAFSTMGITPSDPFSLFRYPVIFLSGDQAAADQLHAIVPDAETAVVKKGLANHACISLLADAARSLIRNRTMAAIVKIESIVPHRVEGPVTIQMKLPAGTRWDPDAQLGLGADVIDARTIRYSKRIS